MIIRYPIGSKLLQQTAATVALGLLLGGAAFADDITFASYTETQSNVQQWTITSSVNNSISTTVTASGAVQFSFSGVTGLPFTGAEDATLTLSATSTQTANCGTDCSSDTSLSQHGYNGTFTIIDSGLGADGLSDGNAGGNLLSGTFSVTPGNVTGSGGQYGSTNIGGSSASFDASADSTNLTQLVLTSQFINFTGQTEADASFSLSSINPSFFIEDLTNPSAGVYQAVPGSATGSGTGTFSSDAPAVAPATTPEPASFVLIGGGLVVLGFLRRKKILMPAEI